MLRLYNRITKMDNSRLPKLVYDWDKSLGFDTWGSEIKHICVALGLDPDLREGETYNLTDAHNICQNS